jgi:acetyltransferase-like isoleucine patch superfamily enzyme
MGYFANKLSTLLWSLFYLTLGKLFFSKLGKGCRFEGWVDIPQRGGIIIFGDGVRICKNVELSVPRGGTLLIDDGCSIGRGVLISAQGKIKIGRSTMLAEYVCLHDNNHVFTDTGQDIADQGFESGVIDIGENCWIGAQSVILKGAVIGNGSVVGAQALVNKKHEPKVVLVGIPAKPVSSRG